MKPKQFFKILAISAALATFSAGARAEVQTLNFSKQDRVLSAFGLDVEYTGAINEDLQVEVTVECVSEQDTPELVLSEKTAAPARLVNATSSEFGCASYIVSVAATDEAAINQFTVGIAIAGIAQQYLDEAAVFFFNPLEGNWTKAEKYRPNQNDPTKSYANLSRNYVQAITGVIAAPKLPSAEPFQADVLSDALESVDPLQGLLNISRVEPDSTGSVSVDLPLLLRPSRGPGPSFSISNSAGTGTGVLGRGWHLHVDAIQVRGPSPIYHPDFETEDYVLNGQELVALDAKGNEIPPLYKGGPILPRVHGVRVFRPRNATQPLIIRRYGDAPDNYFWEVWNPGSKVTQLFGAVLDGDALIPDSQSILTTTMALGSPSAATISQTVSGKWGLSQEFDNQPARSGARYLYEGGLACADELRLFCTQDLRLRRIIYNDAFSETLSGIAVSGVTYVDFTWTERDIERITTSAQVGFLTANQHWLDRIDVHYPAAASNSWLAGVSGKLHNRLAQDQIDASNHVLYSSHAFELSSGRDPCLNFDKVLRRVVVRANAKYNNGSDGDLTSRDLVDGTPSEHEEQAFEFAYTGEIGDRCPQDGILLWQDGTIDNPFAETNAKSGVGFPDGLLSRLGLGALTSSSLLGESNTDETGASIYIGIGPPGNTSDKTNTGGIKAGHSFMQTRGGSTLIDVTGDGIDDVLIRTGNGLKYCAASRHADGSITYKSGNLCGDVYGLNDIAISTASTRNFGVEGYVPFGFFGVGHNSASSETYVYPTDRDGDGLTDFAVYGRVVYGQGETCPTEQTCYVQFRPESSLTPPIPGVTGVVDAAEALEEERRRPPGFMQTINQMRNSFADLRTRLDGLAYSQTSISWEAPLTGTLAFEGQFRLDATVSSPRGDVVVADGLRDYPGLREAAHAFDLFLNDCDEFPDRPHCPGSVGAGHSISFPATPPASIRLELSRILDGSYGTPVVCGVKALPRGGTFELVDILDGSSCARSTADGPVLDIKAGDVLSLSYSVHPDFTASLQPDARYAYKSFLVGSEATFPELAVNNLDPAYDLRLRFGEFDIDDIYSCTWRDQFSLTEVQTDCLLNRQNRYSHTLATGLLTSNASAVALVPKGSDRTIRGQFSVSTELTQDYLVTLDLRGLPMASGNIRAANLPVIFSQDVTAACVTPVAEEPNPVCQVDINLICAANQEQICNAFLSDDAPAWRAALHLELKHRDFPDRPVSNLDGRLTSLTWHSAPRLTTAITEIDENNPAQPPYTRRDGETMIGNPSEPVSKLVAIYLPVSMGSADVERRRVTSGRFVAPNESLNEGSPDADVIDLAKIIDDELSNVALARVRQRIRLCGFAAEIIRFLELRDSLSVSPFAPSRVAFWRERFEVSEQECFSDGLFIQSLDFQDKNDPARPPELDPAADRLFLREHLERLPFAEQVSSAESLLVRVLKNLELPREALTAHPELGEMGYRLPVKANPFDCGTVKFVPVALEQPIYGPEAPCSYRVLMNFAMESILNLFPDDEDNNPHPKREAYEAILKNLLASEAPAFDLELAITVNGRPTLISELTGSPASSVVRRIADTDPLKSTCIGSYGAHGAKGRPPTHFYPDTTTIGGAPGSTIFQRILTNRRPGRVVAFSDDVMHTVTTGAGSLDGLGRYGSLYKMEAKQDCDDMAGIGGPTAKYVAEPTSAVSIQILENNTVSGRNRVFEFEAHPLDIVAFHVRLKPRLRVFSTVSTTNVAFELDGRFSILDSEPKNGPGSIPREEYVIPRSPSQIVPPNLDPVDCGEDPEINQRRLPRTCRPWTRIAWSELLLGAEYRTYSDAHKTTTDKEYSIKRRRDLLRIFPEIEIASDEFRLETEESVSEFAPIAGEQYTEPATAYSLGIAERVFAAPDLVKEDTGAIAVIDGLGEFISDFDFSVFSPPTDVLRLSYFKVREPNIAQIADAWAFWAQKSNTNGSLSQSPAFGDLRYSRDTAAKPVGDPKARYNQAKDACLDGAGTDDESPKFDSCEKDTPKDGTETLNLEIVDVFPLLHRFVGPTHEEQFKVYVNQLIAATDICAIPTPNTFASCWAGLDDTVFLHQPVTSDPSDSGASSEHRVNHPTRSVSAFIGFEQPLIEEFKFDLDALMRVACNGSPNAPSSYCDTLSASPATIDSEKFSEIFAAEDPVGPFLAFPAEPEQALLSMVANPLLKGALVRAPPVVPNRPYPPNPETALHVFAPIQKIQSNAVSRNKGVDIGGLSFNTNKVYNSTRTQSLFVDINGDGFPEHLTGDGSLSGALSSPVGLLRSDWWRFFRAPHHTGLLTQGAQGSGYIQTSRSDSAGAGVGLTPPTFARIHQASMDAAVSPSFNLSFESGKQQTFSDLKDFNGDGILDVLSGETVNGGVRVQLNHGNTVASASQNVAIGRGGDVIVGGNLPGQQPYRTTYSSGFGVRLGFDINSGSIRGGMGLGTRVQGSDGVLMDFTGDGRVDIVVPIRQNGKSYLAVFPNLGNGYLYGRLHDVAAWNGSETSAGETTLVDAGGAVTFGFNALFIRVVFNPAVKKASNQFRELLSVRDVNGDGFPDLARVTGAFKGATNDGGFVPNFALPDEIETVFNYNPDAAYHMLARITSPTRTTQEITYNLHGNTGPELGRTIWVVDKVSEFDGYAPAHGAGFYADGQDIRVDTYSYNDGYFNRAEKRFYGFADVTQTTFGCDLDASRPNECLSLFEQHQSDAPLAGYVLLQERLKQFNNRDYLTKGTVVAEVTTAPRSVAVANPGETAPRLESTGPLEISTANRFAYAIEHLSTLGKPTSLGCTLPSAASQARWNHGKFVDDPIKPPSSVLPPKWGSAGGPADEQNVKLDGGVILGSESICSSNVRDCHEVVTTQACEAGYVLEQTQFWAQQSGSVRNRFSDLHVLATGTAIEEGMGLSSEELIPEEVLYSASAADFDQWGQQINTYSIGDFDIDANPIPQSSIHTYTSYAARNGLSAKLEKVAGGQNEYPILSLAQTEMIFEGPWPKGDGEHPIRVREALYQGSEDGAVSEANITDICQYPVSTDDPHFSFRQGICRDFKFEMQRVLGDGLSSLIDAQEIAYRVPGLPAGTDRYAAIQHTRVVSYDSFGNPTRTIGPLTDRSEWVDQRYSHSADAFLRTPTEIRTTRCVEDGVGVGSDSPGVLSDECDFGVGYASASEARVAITHSQVQRVDPHHGVLGGTKDANGNRVLLDFDQWGRFRLLARDWGAAPRQNRAFAGNLEAALAKNASFEDGPSWNILAAVNYGWPSAGVGGFSSHTQKFSSSNAYEGASGLFNTARNVAIFEDGLGRLIQSSVEAEVCDKLNQDLKRSINPNGQGNLLNLCGASPGSRVTVGGYTDVLEREFATFEGYSGGRASGEIGPSFEELVAPSVREIPVITRSLDSGSRQSSEQHRLSTLPEFVSSPGVLATTQFAYRIVQDVLAETLTRRFQTLALSPRCALTVSRSDPRGLPTASIESQETIYRVDLVEDEEPKAVGVTGDYARDYSATLGHCRPIEEASEEWAEDTSDEAKAKVTYEYDALLQLVGVEYPLSGDDRAAVIVEYDRLGRMTGLKDPDSGCTEYVFDNLNNLVERRSSAYDGPERAGCVASDGPHELRTFEYSADRVIRMTYRSFGAKGGENDQSDTVSFFYDRLPHTTAFGEILEAPRIISNEHANQRFFDVTGKICENCVGQVTVVADRTGARSFNFNPLGQVTKETRSIVAPVTNADVSDGEAETFLPEVAFYELENSYSSFGDITLQEFNESVPTNPSLACIEAGPQTCVSRFSIGTRYAPDGTVSTLLFNNQPMVRAINDRLNRPSVRLMSDGTVSGLFYDEVDLKLNQMATITAATVGDKHKPVQITGYQYDGGGNIHGYRNVAAVGDPYRSHFNFGYDGANRLIEFGAHAATDAAVMNAKAAYGFDLGHRLSCRSLAISGDPEAQFMKESNGCLIATGDNGDAFTREWTYSYVNAPMKAQPVHAPSSITFGVSTSDLRRESHFEYDDVGRLAKVRSGENEAAPGVLSDRRMDWDAAGRLTRVLGGPDEYWRDNVDFLREEYIYDFAGNRVLKIHRPILADDGERTEQEITSIYLTPFYSRPADGRGTVQLSRGSLPVASMTPPVSETAEPRVTFLYPDLAVGTVTASVLATGEVTNAEHTLIARREFSPFGLELTGMALAKPDGAPGALPPVFHGKELDRTTGFSSFGARYYSRDLGMWVSPDPMQADYLFGGPALGVYAPRNLSTYAFSGQNPINLTDMDGNAAVAPLLVIGLAAYTAYEGYKAYDEGGFEGLAVFAGIEGTATVVAGPLGKAGSKFSRAAFARSLPYLESALKTARSTRAPQWVINRLSGRIAEKQAAISLIDRGHTVLGTQMHARLKDGSEVVLDLVTVREGKIFAAEIKSGGALLTSGQNQFFHKGIDVDEFFGKSTIQNLIEGGVDPSTAPNMLRRLYHGRPTP